MKLPTVEAARAAMLAAVAPLPVERVSLAEGDGRWLAEPVRARRDQPPFDSSAMDGWAVRSADMAAGARLRIVGESAAGRGLDLALAPGEAARIFTGAPLPEGADHIVIQEEAERDGETVLLRRDAGPDRFVRPRGCDFRDDQVLIDARVRLNPWRLALAAAAGCDTLTCGAMPRVAILATGNELVEPGGVAGPHQIYNSTAPALAAFARRHAGRPTIAPRALDDDRAILASIAAAEFDLLVTIGGASVGDHDRVKPALRTIGAQLVVEGVAMRPGKPVWFAVLLDGRFVLGLPGNPASALVCAELFLAPLLAALQGGTADLRRSMAILAAPLSANGPRDHYMRARIEPGDDGRSRAAPLDNQDSSLVTVMAAANALVRRPPFAEALPAGALVEVVEHSL